MKCLCGHYKDDHQLDGASYCNEYDGRDRYAQRCRCDRYRPDLSIELDEDERAALLAFLDGQGSALPDDVKAIREQLRVPREEV